MNAKRAIKKLEEMIVTDLERDVIIHCYFNNNMIRTHITAKDIIPDNNYEKVSIECKDLSMEFNLTNNNSISIYKDNDVSSDIFDINSRIILEFLN